MRKTKFQEHLLSLLPDEKKMTTKTKFQEHVLSLLPDGDKIIITSHRGVGKTGGIQ